MAENLTTPEQREALEKAGWTLLDETTFTDSPETSWEAWAAPDRRTVGTVYGDREPDVYGLRDVMGDDERPIPANVRFAAEFAAILGITPSTANSQALRDACVAARAILKGATCVQHSTGFVSGVAVEQYVAKLESALSATPSQQVPDGYVLVDREAASDGLQALTNTLGIGSISSAASLRRLKNALSAALSPTTRTAAAGKEP